MSESQLTLDDYAPGHRPPRARKGDPLSSHAAADRLERSGRMGEQSRAVLALVRSHPGLTAKQIDVLLHDEGRWNRAAGRRLSELERKGLVRRGTADGDRELRWFPVREAT